ncbi:MAG: DOMON-like domain-containing protein [Cyanobacteria bacterium J06554_3]
MAATEFELVPFDATPQTAELSVKGRISRKKNVLSIQYRLAGALPQVAIPPIGKGGSRQDKLWEKTCFEFFLSAEEAPEQAPYWEFNLSPSGDWNVFSLTGYRQGLKEESAYKTMPFEVWRGFQGLQLEVSVPLENIVRAKQPIYLGVSAVVVLKSGMETFWAIAHPAPAPDFHSLGSFTLQL